MKTIFTSLCLRKIFRRDSRLRRAVGALMIFNFTLNVLANPTGLTVQSGHATFTVNGSQLTVTAGNNAMLNWQSFNIAAGEKTVFNQPSASSVVWNRINNNQGASQIYGSLQANGVVVLLNSSGFYFGPNSFVSAAGLVVSTANCQPPQNGGGGWEFNGPPPLASIVNYGQIKIGNGGDCFFIADKVENHGLVEAPGGNIGFAAGQTVTLSERPDGRGMSMQVTLPKGSVDNYGNVIADGGTISLHAKVVNQNGFIQANSVLDQNGVIELVAADTLNLGANSKIVAQGDTAAAGSAGGSVTLQSGNIFSDAEGGKIITAGGANGGNGGNVEISAPNIQSLNTAMDAGAQNSFAGGEFLLDPVNIILGNTGSGTVPANGTVAYSSSGTLSLNVNTAFANKNFSNIKLQATGNITLNAGTQWDLSASTGQSSGLLTLQAGGNITLGTGSLITDANNWSLNLMAGVVFPAGTIKTGTGNILLNGTIQTTGGSVGVRAGNAIQAGTAGMVATTDGDVVWQAGGDITFGSNSRISADGIGNVMLAAGYNFANSSVTYGGNLIGGVAAGSIYLNGGPGKNLNGFIQSAAGEIDLTAGNDILVGIGAVRTTGGGSIMASALSGSVDTGSLAKGYYFQDAESGLIYGVDASLGGISTAAGGNVSITAGLDVISQLPSGSRTAGDAGTGAFGSAPGDVTITAGRNVTGHYVVANGTGTITAGSDAGGSTDSSQLALSLIKGGWNVNASDAINLSEVRNPNGIFNNVSGQYYSADNYPHYDQHYFDYDPADYVKLTAGNAVVLGAGKLPRNASATETAIPVLYPGTLDITAGAGGVTLVKNLTLFPSEQGSLAIKTTGGGSLSGSGSDLVALLVSDSANVQYKPGTFGQTDYAQTPLHLDNPTSLTLDISGDMNNLLFIVPEAAQINVVGNMNNSRFQGMNLHASDVTSITVGQAAKINMENKGILNPATDGGLKVGGDIINRSEFSYATISYAPPISDLELTYVESVNALQAYLSLEHQLHYDPVSGKITFQGRMTSDQLAALTSLTIQLVDANGNPRFDSSGNPLLDTVHILDAATAQKLYDDSQSVPVSGINTGYLVGGGGLFNLTARNMDLGTTLGIQSVGPLKDYAMANYFAHGADINVNLTGDLDMFSAAICSFNGGAISVLAGGNMNIGSSGFTGNDALARGIFTAEKSDVTVIAGGNLNVDGSRIAAYDGGNVTAISLNGDINIGSGGLGFVRVDKVTVPQIGQPYQEDLETIPGSGIITTTFPSSQNQIGSILVETPHGNVIAGTGGIIQLPLNPAVKSPDSTVAVLAGYLLKDSSGNPMTATSLGTPVIQGSLAPAGPGEPAQTVVVGSQRIPVSAAVWSQLSALLGLAPDSSQTLVCNVPGDTAGFIAYLQGNSADLSQYNFASRTAEGKNLDATGSGIIGQNLVLKATGELKGVFYSPNRITLDAGTIGPTVALGKTIDATGPASGPVTLIGSDKVNYSGSGDPTILSTDANGQGSTFAQGTVANATAAAASNQEAGTETQAATSTDSTDDLKKKKGIALAQKVSRVTVILPPKKLSETTTKTPQI